MVVPLVDGCVLNDLIIIDLPEIKKHNSLKSVQLFFTAEADLNGEQRRSIGPFIEFMQFLETWAIEPQPLISFN